MKYVIPYRYDRVIYPAYQVKGMSGIANDVELQQVAHLRNVKKADMLTDGVRLVFSFTLPERKASVNGQLCGVTSNGNTFPIDVRGSPIGHCGFCGHMPIYNHYTLKNKRTGEEINVGSECLADIYEAKKNGNYIVKSIESVKRKVSTDYRRPLKQKDILAYLQMLESKGIVAARNKRIDETLAKYPHHFVSINLDQFVPEEYKQSKGKPAYGQPPKWSVWGYCKDMGISDDQFKEDHFAEAWALVEHEKNNDQQAIRLQDAKKVEQKVRNFWNYHLQVFASKDWAPATMKKEYEFEAKQDGFTETIKWTPLTEEQAREERELVDKAVNAWIASLERRGARV